MGRAIFKALADRGPLTPKAVAAACDYEYSGTFRETVKGLADAGELVRTDDGRLSIDRRHAGAVA